MKTAPVLVLVLAACHGDPHRPAPEAGASASPTASSMGEVPAEASAGLDLCIDCPEDDLPVEFDAGTPCPWPVHPGYCRRSCRTYEERSSIKHARRVRSPARAGVGTCGSYKVFAEDEEGGRGDVASGIVEYFDSTGELVGAIDTRQRVCGKYGTIPKCTPRIAWGRPHSGGLRDIQNP